PAPIQHQAPYNPLNNCNRFDQGLSSSFDDRSKCPEVIQPKINAWAVYVFFDPICIRQQRLSIDWLLMLSFIYATHQ
ncbi:MAG: hypothetical protein KGO83_06335, partial [Paenibacillaceae bacterium]|nr:hypothetical protein [Paenibacillaceae bacterium]